MSDFSNGLLLGSIYVLTCQRETVIAALLRFLDKASANRGHSIMLKLQIQLGKTIPHPIKHHFHTWTPSFFVTGFNI